MPLVPSLPRVPPGPKLQGPHQETRLSRKGLHSTSQVGKESQDEEEGQFLALSQVLRLELVFGTVYKVSLGLGGQGGGDTGGERT